MRGTAHAIPRPTLASVMPKRAEVLATHMSHICASSQPPAKATPFTAAMTGLETCTLSPRTGRKPRGSTPSFISAISLRSAPAQNALSPAPVRMPTRRDLSASRRLQASKSPLRTPALRALRFSGRLIVMTAIPSSTVSNITSSAMALSSEAAPQQLVGCPLERLAKVWMRDCDHPACALGQRLGAQIGGAELRHDNVRVAARGCHAAVEPMHDAAHAAAAGGCRQGDDGPSAGRAMSCAHVVCLPADAANVLASHLLRIDLPREVDLDRRVDGDELGNAPEHGIAVREIGWLECDRGIEMGERIEPFRTDQGSSHRHALVERLGRIRQDAALDEIDHRVGHHARVQAEIAAIADALQDGVRNRADAHLQRGAVLDVGRSEA